MRHIGNFRIYNFFKSSLFHHNLVSTVIFSSLNLVLFKYFKSEPKGSNIIFWFAVIQQLNQIISVYLIYGIMANDNYNRKTINPLWIILATVPIILLFPKIGILIFLLIRGILLRFSVKSVNKQTINILLLAFGTLIIYSSQLFRVYDLRIFGVSIILSIFIFNLFGYGAINIPSRYEFTFDRFLTLIKRTAGDYGLLLAPLIITLYIKANVEGSDYIQFQLGLTSLGFIALLSGLIERLSFEKHLLKITNTSKILNPVHLLLGVIITTIIALYLEISTILLIPLALNAVLGPVFAFYWNKLRFINKRDVQITVGLGIILATIIWICLNHLVFNDSIFTALSFMALATLIKIIYLYISLNKWNYQT